MNNTVKPRESQEPPAGNWRMWIVSGGRGSGKTFALANWLSGMAEGRYSRMSAGGVPSFLVVGHSASSLYGSFAEAAMDISGHGACFRPSKGTFEWPGRISATLITPASFDSLRGMSFSAIVFDNCPEIAVARFEECRMLLSPGGRIAISDRSPVYEPLLKLSDRFDTVITELRVREKAAAR